MALELIATALIRYTYMKSPLGPTVLQVLVGGAEWCSLSVCGWDVWGRGITWRRYAGDAFLRQNLSNARVVCSNCSNWGNPFEGVIFTPLHA